MKKQILVSKLFVTMCIFDIILAFGLVINASELSLMLFIYFNIILISFKIRYRSSPDLLEPFLVFMAIYTCYCWFSGISMINKQVYSLSVMRTYFICVILGLLGFVLGYLGVFTSKNRIICKITSIKVPYTNLFKIFLAFTICLVIINYHYVFQYFNLADIKPYTETSIRGTRTAWSGALSYISEITLQLLLFTVLLRTFVRRKWSIFALFYLALVTLIAIKGGAKGEVIKVILILAIYINYYKRRLPTFKTLAVFLCLIMFITMYNHVRSTSSIVEMINLTVINVKSNPLNLIPTNGGELGGLSEILCDGIQAINTGMMTFTHGASWVNDLLVFIPSFMFNQRPLPMSEQYVKMFYPSDLLGTGRGWFILSDGYWAFGYVGVVLIMFLYGALLAIFYRHFKNNINNGAFVLVYSLVYLVLVGYATRTGFFGTIKASIMVLLPYILLFETSRIRITKKNYKQLSFKEHPNEVH